MKGLSYELNCLMSSCFFTILDLNCEFLNVGIRIYVLIGSFKTSAIHLQTGIKNIIIILLSSILFIASLVAFNIDLPIDLYSPDKGTINPILIFSSAKIWWILSIIPISVKIINWINEQLFLP